MALRGWAATTCTRLHRRPTVDLHITVAKATGSGPTVIAAFDDALEACGTSRYNLIRLSSMIPAGATVSTGAPNLDGAWGDRLYAVWAFKSAQLLGEEAWAGIAWLQHPEERWGVFVEHEGSSEAQVREELRASLDSLGKAHGLTGADEGMSVCGCRCDGEPVAALVIAPFTTEPW